MLLGLDNWSFGFAWGMRSEFKPSRTMTCHHLIEKIQEYGLKGSQVGLHDMPALNSPEFKAFQEKIHDLGLFWEVSAGLVSDEEAVLEALDYAVALKSRVVRAFMENFGIQFRFESLNDYVSDAISHLRNIMPKVKEKGLFLCIENHGGLRMEYIRRVLDAIRSDHLGICLDTGNPVLTLEDPVEVIKELASRAYTVHLKDWKLVKTNAGILARGCSLGDGVVDLPTVVEILKRCAPYPDKLHLNIETAQEYIQLNIFTAEFWKYHKEVSGGELGKVLRLVEKRDANPTIDYRLAYMRGASETEILAEEESAIQKSIQYAREVLEL